MMRLISIHSFFFCLLRLSVADLKCYKCIWANGYLLDSCSPTQFNESVIPIEVCKYGCMITASYMFDSMFSYARACALRNVESRYTCREGVESSIKQVDCFCTTELCNGLDFGMKALEFFSKSSVPDDISGTTTNDDAFTSHFISRSPTNEAETSEFTSESSISETAMAGFTSGSPFNKVVAAHFTSGSPVISQVETDFTSESPANQVSDGETSTITSSYNSGCIFKDGGWSISFVFLALYLCLS